MAEPKEGYNSGITRVVSSGAIDSDGNYVAGGAAHVAVQSKLNEPSSWFSQVDSTAPDVNTTTVVYASGDVSMYDRMEFVVKTAPGAGSIGAYVSQNGTDFFGPVQVVDRTVTVGSWSQSKTAVVALGAYYLQGRFKNIEIRNVGATTGAAASVSVSHSVGVSR